MTQEQSRYHKKQFSQSAAQWKGVAFAGGQKLALSTAQGARKHARMAGGLDLPSVGGKTADGLGKAAETPAESASLTNSEEILEMRAVVAKSGVRHSVDTSSLK